MAGEKIASLNEALRQMVESFRNLGDTRANIWLCVINFADKAMLALPPTPVADAVLSTLSAGGKTAMGDAFRLAGQIIEDRTAIPRGSYLPTLVLFSDGRPNIAGWEAEIEHLLASPRSGRAMRLAMALGGDADEAMLRRFIGNSQVPLVRSGDAQRIQSFFRLVTFTVAKRSMSLNPNELVADLLPVPQSVDLDDDDLVF
jgi:uncharacterized protein YegL